MATSLYMFFNESYILVFELINFIPLSVFIYIFFPIGLILFVFGIWGCSALLKNSSFSLNIFFILNFAVFGTVLAAVVMTEIGFIPELKTVTESYLDSNVTLDYDANYAWQMDDYQKDVECCGLGGNETCFNWEFGVPDSCFCDNELNNGTACVILADTCYNGTTPFQVFSGSCTDELNNTLGEFITLFEVLTKSIAAVCFLTVLFSSCVICCGNCNK